jgi:hypothetical protein
MLNADEGAAPASLPTDAEIMAAQDVSPLLRVNGQEVPRWMFDNAMRDRLLQKGASAAELTPNELAGHQREILKNLVLMEALEQEAKRYGLEVGVAGGALRSQIIRGRYKSQEDFRRALANAGMTEKQFAAIWQQQASVNRLIDEKVLAGLYVREAEVQARYERDKAKYPGASLEDIRDQLIGVLSAERRQNAFARYTEDLLARTKVEVLDPALEEAYGG